MLAVNCQHHRTKLRLSKTLTTLHFDPSRLLASSHTLNCREKTKAHQNLIKNAYPFSTFAGPPSICCSILLLYTVSTLHLITSLLYHSCSFIQKIAPPQPKSYFLSILFYTKYPPKILYKKHNTCTVANSHWCWRVTLNRLIHGYSFA